MSHSDKQMPTPRDYFMSRVIEQIRSFCEHLSKTNVGYIGKLKPEAQTQPVKLILIHEQIKSAGGKLSPATLTFTIR